MAGNRIEAGSQIDASYKVELGNQAGAGNRATLCRVEIPLKKNYLVISFNKKYVKSVFNMYCQF